MPSAADGLPLTKFGPIVFPSEVTDLDGVGRDHVHEYPHTPGGAPEKLGRGLYTVTVKARFHATFPGYPDLYPNSMQTMRGYYELQTTLPFTHPSSGQFPAYIIHWHQVKSGKVLSGEDVDITFREDQQDSFALSALSVSADDTAIGPTYQELLASIAAVQSQLQITPQDQSLIDALTQSVDSVLAFRDTAQLAGNRYAAAVDHVLSLASQLDHAASMQDARAWPVITVLRRVQGNAIGIKKDLMAQRQTLTKYFVPSPMSVAEVAMSLYGDASKQTDIMALNSAVIRDPLNIGAGVALMVYPSTPQELAQKLSA